MRLPRIVFLLSLLAVMSAGCTEEVTAPEENSVNVEVHLQQGFADQWVWIQINGQLIFNALLSAWEPFAGPQALFSTVLPRGRNGLEAGWRSLAWDTPALKDSTDFQLGSADRYYIGLRIADDTLQVVLQDSAFAYF